MPGKLRGNEVHVRQLGNGMAHLVVDRSGELAALDMDERHVHVRGRDRVGDRLVAVGDGHDGVGSEPRQHGGQFHQRDADAAHRLGNVVTFKHRIDLGGDVEPVLPDDVGHAPIAVEQRGGGEHDSQLDPGMIAQWPRARS